MVWEVIGAAALGGFAGSTVQAFASRRNMQDQIEATNQRRAGEFYLEKKVEALTDVFRTMVEAYNTYHDYYTQEAALSQKDLESEILPKYEEFTSAQYRAALFLETEDTERLVRLRDQFKMMNEEYLTSAQQGGVDPMDAMGEAYFECTKMMESKFSEPLNAFSSLE